MEFILKDIPVIIISPNETDKYIERVTHTINNLNRIGFKNVKIWKSAITPEYCMELRRVTADILENNLNDDPVLIVEDDISITTWHSNYLENLKITIPEKADAFYLGNYRFLVHPTEAKLYKPVEIPSCSLEDGETRTFRITNMLGTHAIIYLSKKYKEEVIKLFRDPTDGNHNDVILARNLGRFNVHTLVPPLFYQDGKFSNSSMEWCTNFVL